MIRTLFTIVPLLFYAFTQVMAQHTFDVKFNDAVNNYPGGFTGLYRYTKEKTLVCGSNGINGSRNTYFAVFDNEGTFINTKTLPFRRGWVQVKWYNKEDKLIYILMDESIGKYLGFPWHLITMDTNLNVINDKRLDSTVMGLSANMSKVIAPQYIRLSDSTLLLTSGYTEYTEQQNALYQRMAYIIDNKGRVISTYKFQSYSRNDEPLYRKSNGEIFWRYSFKDPLNIDKIGYRLSNTNFEFIDKKDSISLPDFYSNNDYARNFTPTGDGGFALLRMVYEKPETAELIKYDSQYTKQWSVLIPSHSDEKHQLIENKNGGFFVITQTITDTTISLGFQECLQDIAVSKISAEGKLQFTAYYGSGTCIQVVYNAIKDNDGGIVISGRYNASKFTTCNNTCSTPEYEWLLKIDTLGGGARLLTSVMEQSDELNETILYPNPTSDILYVNTEFSSIDIFNSNAENVYSSNMQLSNSKSIDISNLGSGLYFCRIAYKNGTIVKPFIVQH